MPSIPPQTPEDTSLAEQLRAYINSLTKSSHTQQIAVGSGSGIVCGYLSAKVGKWVAITGGVSLLLLQVAKDKGYVKFNSKKLSDDLSRLRDQLEDQLPNTSESEVAAFVKKYSYLGLSFAGGFLIGIGLS